MKGITRSTPSIQVAGLDMTWVKQWAMPCDFKKDDMKKVLASLRMRQSTPDECKCRTALRMVAANGMSAMQACASNLKNESIEIWQWHLKLELRDATARHVLALANKSLSKTALSC